MSKKRRSYEAGHSPKFLVVIDDSPECDRALYFASRRAPRPASITGVMPQRVIREGEKTQEVLNLIEDDEDIAILVLAAATDKEGPGRLVSSVSKTAGDFPIPVAIVPGHLSDEELDAMS